MGKEAAVLLIRVKADAAEARKELKNVYAIAGNEAKTFVRQSTLTTRQMISLDEARAKSAARVSVAEQKASRESLRTLSMHRREAEREYDRQAKAAQKSIAEVSNAYKKAEREQGKLSGARGGGLSGLSGFAIGGAVAGSAILLKQGLIDAKNAGRDLVETISKSSVVFKSNAAEIEQWGDTAAQSMGMSKREAMENAASFAALFANMKLGLPTSTLMSKSLVQLSADLASFHNQNPEDVMRDLFSGLTGQMEPLRKYGINLAEAQVKQEALRMGLIRTTKEALEPATRAQAAYSIILKESKQSQGDFARTANETANAERRLNSEISDLKAKIGLELLPAYKDTLNVAHGLLKAFEDTPQSVKTFEGAILGLTVGGGALAMLIKKLKEVQMAGIAAGLLTPVTATVAGVGAVLGLAAHSAATSMIAGSEREIKANDTTFSQNLMSRAAQTRKKYSYLSGYLMYSEDPTDTRGFSPRNQFESNALKEAGAQFDPQTGNVRPADVKKLRAYLNSLLDSALKDEAFAPRLRKYENEGAARTAAAMKGLAGPKPTPQKHPFDKTAADRAARQAFEALQREKDAAVTLAENAANDAKRAFDYKLAAYPETTTQNTMAKDRAALLKLAEDLREKGLAVADATRVKAGLREPGDTSKIAAARIAKANADREGAYAKIQDEYRDSVKRINDGTLSAKKRIAAYVQEQADKELETLRLNTERANAFHDTEEFELKEREKRAELANSALSLDEQEIIAKKRFNIETERAFDARTLALKGLANLANREYREALAKDSSPAGIAAAEAARKARMSVGSATINTDTERRVSEATLERDITLGGIAEDRRTVDLSDYGANSTNGGDVSGGSTITLNPDGSYSVDKNGKTRTFDENGSLKRSLGTLADGAKQAGANFISAIVDGRAKDALGNLINDSRKAVAESITDYITDKYVNRPLDAALDKATEGMDRIGKGMKMSAMEITAAGYGLLAALGQQGKRKQGGAILGALAGRCFPACRWCRGWRMARRQARCSRPAPAAARCFPVVPTCLKAIVPRS
jgi:hypothetical protein